jgi:cytidylate kinase
MYRAATWLALQRGVPLDDAARLAALAESAQLELTTDPAPVRVRVDGTDVTEAIRGAAVTAAVSAVSAVAGVRTAMVARQRAVIGTGGIVVEGRDIGTTVAPDAPLKVFLTADPAARAQRRLHEQEPGTDDPGAVDSARAALLARDDQDRRRTTSPLTQAADAVVVDATHESAEQVVDQLVRRVAALVGS